jgi:ribosome maturation protein SDO1
LEYRSGAETDLDNVLQIHTVFLSVSIQEILQKGEVQVGERERKEVLERIEKEVVDIVSGRLVDPSTKRVYTTGMIEKALNQLSAASGQVGGHGHQPAQGQGQGEQDPHSPPGTGTGAAATNEAEGDNNGAVQQPRKPHWKGVVTTKSAKSPALEAMKALIAWQPIPVMRARMRLRVTCPVSLLKHSVKPPTAASNKAADGPSKGHKKGSKSRSKRHAESESEEFSDAENTPKVPGTVKDKILSYIESVETQDTVETDDWEVVGFAEPGALKGLSEFVTGETRGRGRVEVLDMLVTHED